MAHEICCVGHITLDRIITPRRTVNMPGGTSYYFAHAMAHLCPEAMTLVTALGESEMGAVEDIRREGIEVKVIGSPCSVFFENAYGENSDERKQRVLAKAKPFAVGDLLDVEADFIHLGTLLADDFSIEAIKYLSTKGRLSVDAQGYLREVRGDKVYAIDWADKAEALRYIDILKVNEHEMEMITGCSDGRRAARMLAEAGVKEVLLTFGSMGSMIYAEGEFHKIPAYRAAEVVDATGCGDTYMAGYLYKRSRGASYDEAGRFAAAMCTLKLAQSGPFGGTEAEVEAVVARG